MVTSRHSAGFLLFLLLSPALDLQSQLYDRRKLDLKSPLNQLFYIVLCRIALVYDMASSHIDAVNLCFVRCPVRTCSPATSFAVKRYVTRREYLPFVLPTVVVAAAFTALFGRSGVLNVWLMQGI